MGQKLETQTPMSFARRPSNWWGGIALLATALVPVSAVTDEAGKALLRRKRITSELKPADVVGLAQHGNVADLWEQEAALAELDAERILQGYLSMSISIPTPSPTDGPPGFCLVDTTREDYLLELLSPITPIALLRDPSTPQGMAFNWTLNEDPMLADDPCNYPTKEQRYGLATLYFATTGAQWTDSENWLTDTAECEWKGIICGGENEETRKLQGSPGRVVKVNLPFNNLAGTIPHEIVTLYELEALNIFANSLTSTLPESLGTLRRMVFIDAERNLMSGPLIGDNLLQLSNLQALRLSRNDFTGTIPPQIAKWTDLEQFWISNNVVVGSIPREIGMLTNLKTMFLYDNDIHMRLPSEMGLLTQLSILRLDGNMIESTIPEEFYQLTNLVDLRLDGNFLTGSISPAIGALTRLTDLRLNENMLIGTLPDQLAELTLLQNLILFDNHLTGFLPAIFGGYGVLEQLDISMNFFGGALPEALFELPQLTFVYLSNNTFFGPLPSNFQKPPLLRDLYLDGNQLTGTIPPVETGSLQNLNEILFNYNSFSGTMPQSFCDLRLDYVLDDLFADCMGDAPKVICDFPDCCNRCFDASMRPTRRQRRILHKRGESS